MPKELYQISLKLILKNENGEALILKAQERGSYAGFYDFPGGRINSGEFNTPIMEILEREVREEIGNIKYSSIKSAPVAIGRHSFIASWGVPEEINKDAFVLYLFFEGNYIDGDIKISEEHTDYKWVKLEDLELEKYFKSGILEGIKMYLKN